MGSLLYAGLGDDAEALILAFLMGPITIFLWYSRNIWRRNAERWRLRRPDAF